MRQAATCEIPRYRLTKSTVSPSGIAEKSHKSSNHFKSETFELYVKVAVRGEYLLWHVRQRKTADIPRSLENLQS